MDDIDISFSPAEAGSDSLDRMQHEAGEMVHQTAETDLDTMDDMQQDTGDLVQRNGEQMGQMAPDADNYVQEPLH